MTLASGVEHNKFLTKSEQTPSLGPSAANYIQPQINDVILFQVWFIFVVIVHLLAGDIGSPFMIMIEYFLFK